MRWPGIEPGSTAWKATMLTITPPSLPEVQPDSKQVTSTILHVLRVAMLRCYVSDQRGGLKPLTCRYAAVQLGNEYVSMRHLMARRRR